MRTIALLLIRGYQRFISPYKGFSCAYRQCTGSASCSEIGLRAVRRYGLVKGCKVLRTRLELCGRVFRERVEHRQLAVGHFASPSRGAKHAQMGFIDGCDGIEGICDAGSCACDAANCMESCYFPSFSSRLKRAEQVRPMKRRRRLFGD